MENSEYYGKFLDYKSYKNNLLGTSPNLNITYDNFIQTQNIQKIFAETLNESMVWLFIWELWIKKPATCYSYYISNKKPTRTTQVSFDQFNFNPYDTGKNKQIAILNFEDIITFFNKGVKNENFSQLIKDENIKKFLTKLNIQKVDYYIDQLHSNLKDSLGGTFLSVLSAFDILPDEYYSKEKFITSTGQTIIDYKLLSETRGFTDTITRINDFEIVPNKLQYGDLTKSEYFQRQQEDLESISSKIYLIIQSFLDMYCSIYNDYYNEVVKSPKDPPSIDMSAFNISKQDASSLPLEQYILMAKPKIKPAFKKSYIVRENNLKPYLTIRMEYQVGENSNDFIDVNYFDIPYNNILSIEHNVKEFSMTINLTDTEGNLSELLIQKMYAVSQRKNNAMVEKNIDSMGEYRFFIEYGWSGPNSDDVDELMEDQVYVKTIHRGYIKSISSQYSFKGNEYTLTIIPNDLNSYNSGLNDTSSLYFRPMGDEKVTIPLGLLALFFLFKNPANDLFENINKMKGWPESPSCKNEEHGFLQKLFSFLDHIKMVRSNGQGYLVLQEQDTSPQIVLNGGGIANRLDADADAILDLLMDKTTNKSGQRTNRLAGANLTEINLDTLKDKFDSANVSLNGWLAGLYVIWKLKQDGDLILCDTTGLFDVFDGNIIKDFIAIKRIESLNPYALDKNTKELKGADDQEKIYNYIKIGESKSKFNKYSLSELFNLEPNNNIVDDNPRPLTFLIAQLSAIFSEIKNIGMDCSDEKGNPNVFHAANGIRMNYDFFKPGKDNEEDLFFEYKKKIYSDRNNIYVSEAPPIEKDNRHEERYETFKNHVKEVFDQSKAKVDQFKSNIDGHNKEIEKFKVRTEKFQSDKEDFDSKQAANSAKSSKNKTKVSNQKELDKEKKILAAEEKNINAVRDELNKKFSKYDKKYRQKFPIRIIYLSYITDPNKVAFLNCGLGKKVSLLGKQLVQSYSFTPRISPRTRNANKQFFSQGNRQIMYEGTGDIIEFSIDPLDIGNFNSVMLANKNKNNVGGFNGLNSNLYAGGMYQNATQYYRSFRSIEGGENPYKIAEDMARLDRNYQTQTTLKGSITIPGEPYWSNINLLMAKCIYIHVYYANGMRSSHSGLYYVSGVIQNITEGKFTTRLEIVRAPTFLASLEKKMNKNTHLG